MLQGAGAKAWGLRALQCFAGMGGMAAAGRGPSAPVAASLQPPEDDAAIVGAVRLLSVLIAALTMDLAGRKVLLFVSGEFRHLSSSCHVLCPLRWVPCAWGLQEAWVRPALVAPASPAPGIGPGMHQLLQKGLLVLL